MRILPRPPRASRFATAGFLLLAGLVGARAGVSVYLSPEALSARAELIVEGTVVESRSGMDPVTGRIATYTTLDVEVVHRGPAALERLVLREPGGRFGERIHVLDSVPIYVPRSRVFVYLEAAGDGALRTAGMFFGKLDIEFTEHGDIGHRDLTGDGRLPRRTERKTERFRIDDLGSLAASVQPGRGRGQARGQGRGEARRARPARGPRSWFAEPPELARIRWDDDDPAAGRRVAAFTTLSASFPSRWHQSDNGTPVIVDVQRSGNPLGDGPLAVTQIRRAADAWTEVAEARIALALGNDDADFSASNPSPAQSYPPSNIVLFDDPYNDISDPNGCAGVLAIGGYWAGGPQQTVNGVAFYSASRLYVIFNNDFACLLGNADNLAEVATHELGHGLGIGHSTVPDAIMRSTFYGGRGPRLGDDDRDAAHCFYPHELTLLSPTGGETMNVGESWSVWWSTTPEAGPDSGVVDVEYSADGGIQWTTVSAGETNDGSYGWTVPDDPGTTTRLRVRRPNRIQPPPAAFPEACSETAASSDFTISATAPVAGSVPDGAPAAPLTLAKVAGGSLQLDWSASCSAEATAYAVYEGDLATLRAGLFAPVPRTCDAGLDLTEQLTPGGGDVYFLVAPLAGSAEGELGKTSAGVPRPEPTIGCATRESAGCP